MRARLGEPLRLARHARTRTRTGSIEVDQPALKTGGQRAGGGLVGGEGEAALSVGFEVGDSKSAAARRCLPGGLYRIALTGPLRGPPVRRVLPVGDVVGSPRSHEGGPAGLGIATPEQRSLARPESTEPWEQAAYRDTKGSW